MLAPVPVSNTTVTVEEAEWVPATGTANGMSAADLNRMDVLRTVHFDFDSARIRADQAATMESNAFWLLDHPDARIIVEGHCDERGTREYNLALGERRANSVRDYMIVNGIDSYRIESISYGEERPIGYGSGESNWAQNRRVELVLIN